MLTIDREQSYGLCLSKKEPLVTKAFLIGAFFATLFHVLGMLLIDVHPFSSSDSTTILPPISVMMIANSSPSPLVAAYPEEELILHKLPERPPFSPSPPSLECEPLRPLVPLVRDFLPIEEISLPVCSSPECNKQKLELVALGRLSDVLSFRNDDTLNHLLPSDKEGIRLEVSLDMMNGRVVWIKPLELISFDPQELISCFEIKKKEEYCFLKGEVELRRRAEESIDD